MKNKSILGFALFIFFYIMIIILALNKNRDNSVKEQATVTLNEMNSLEQMAILENNIEKDESSLTSTEEIPDYTKLYPDLYTVYSEPKDVHKGIKIAYLTFDDGPSENTFKVLDILDEYNIKATFFIVGSAIDEEGEDCLDRMVHEGHTLGIHTYSHVCNEIYCSIERFLEDFNLVYQQIYDITGERVNIYRFPLGSLNGYSKRFKDALIEEMLRRGFTCFDWNVSGNDSIGKPTSYSIRRNIEKDLVKQEHPIILLHDSVINDLTVKTLPSIIEMIMAEGYEFDTLDNREPYQFPW